jgi:uncharacterized protein with NRDE domain
MAPPLVLAQLSFHPREIFAERELELLELLELAASMSLPHAGSKVTANKAINKIFMSQPSIGIV